MHRRTLLTAALAAPLAVGAPRLWAAPSADASRLLLVFLRGGYDAGPEAGRPARVQELRDEYDVVLIDTAPALSYLTVNAFIAERDPAKRVELAKAYQKVYTENLDGIGLVAYPGALIINKRFANIPAGAPIFMYNWAEDNIIRERVFVPTDKQIGAELHPNTLPGELGGAGPVAAN